MTIKKNIAHSPTKPADADTAQHSTGGAVLADRFRLDAPQAKAKAPSGPETVIALVAGVLALVIAGVLTFVMYGHWEFLQGA